MEKLAYQLEELVPVFNEYMEEINLSEEKVYDIWGLGDLLNKHVFEIVNTVPGVDSACPYYRYEYGIREVVSMDYGQVVEHMNLWFNEDMLEYFMQNDIVGVRHSDTKPAMFVADVDSITEIFSLMRSIEDLTKYITNTYITWYNGKYYLTV